MKVPGTQEGNARSCSSTNSGLPRAPWVPEGGRAWNAYDIEDGTQEVNQDGREDDDVPGQVGLVDPTASFPEDEGQTLVILRRGDEDQGRVQHDQDGELDGHWHSPAGKHRALGHVALIL